MKYNDTIIPAGVKCPAGKTLHEFATSQGLGGAWQGNIILQNEILNRYCTLALWELKGMVRKMLVRS